MTPIYRKGVVGEDNANKVRGKKKKKNLSSETKFNIKSNRIWKVLIF